MIDEDQFIAELEHAVAAAGGRQAFAHKHNIHTSQLATALGCQRKNRYRIPVPVALAMGYRRIWAYEPLRRPGARQ